MKLSILIATVESRKKEFDLLTSWFTILMQGNPEIELLSECDNKQISIGAKRQKLLERATGDYIVFFDDDDQPEYNYIDLIMQVIRQSPDCIGMIIRMSTNGENYQTCCHSLKYKKWANNVDGYDYVRSVTHFNPVKRELALKVGFKDLRFGEDKDYSDRLTPLCKNEVFIKERLFHYRYTTNINHKEKYGIK
jgi:glycosyltransferase involved in cell wall biosynthesis